MTADPCALRTPRPGTKMPDTDTGFSGIIKTVEGNEARVSKGQTNMATIFTVSDNRTSDTLAFSSADAMLAYVRDLSEDLAPEGATLMLGGVPASNKVVKAHFARSSRGTFTVAGEGADAVASIQSKIDGAVKACAALGIDPDNVAKVSDLRADLVTAMASVSTDDDSLTIEVRELVLHKRRKSNR